MASEIVMPQMGAEMEEGTVVRWVKQPGEYVNRGDVIAEIETDKATVDLESFDEGVFLGSVVETGLTLPVGTIIGYLGAQGEALPAGAPPVAAASSAAPEAASAAGSAAMPSQQSSESAPPAGQPLAAATGAEPPATASIPAPPPAAEPERAPATSSPVTNGARAAIAADAPVSGGRLRVSPVARSMAEELGIDLAGVRGSGPDGRIMRRDIEEHARSRPGTAPATVPAEVPSPMPVAAPEPEPPAAAPSVPAPVAGISRTPAAAAEPLTKMRQAIARRMSAAKREMPHYYLTMSVDMTEALALRTQFNGVLPDDQRISVNDLIIKATALALERYPRFNAAFNEDGLRYHPAIHIGIAVALDDGLIVPAVLDCQGKSLGAIARQAADVTARARAGHLKPAEISDGTFTISNLGMYGVETLIAIIQPGQSAILGAGRSEQRPVVRDGSVIVRDVMTLALSADHRVSDGAEGARFLSFIKDVLEAPLRLAL